MALRLIVGCKVLGARVAGDGRGMDVEDVLRQRRRVRGRVLHDGLGDDVVGVQRVGVGALHGCGLSGFDAIFLVLRWLLPDYGSCDAGRRLIFISLS